MAEREDLLAVLERRTIIIRAPITIIPRASLSISWPSLISLSPLRKLNAIPTTASVCVSPTLTKYRAVASKVCPLPTHPSGRPGLRKRRPHRAAQKVQTHRPPAARAVQAHALQPRARDHGPGDVHVGVQAPGEARAEEVPAILVPVYEYGEGEVDREGVVGDRVDGV